MELRLHRRLLHGITEILDVQAPLSSWAGPQHWNDPDMLEVGVHGTFTPTEKVWAKPLSDGSVAVALLNRSGSTATISTTVGEARAPTASGYHLYDLWTKSVRNTSGAISATVSPHGVVMYRLRTGSATATDTFSLRGVGSGRCLDVLGGAPNDGTQAVIWDCNGGFTQVVTASSGRLHIGGKCLDADNNGTADGTKVIVWTCGSGANQQWTLQSDGTVRGVQSGKCVDVNQAATANNSPLILWTCSGATNQQWIRI